MAKWIYILIAAILVIGIVFIFNGQIFKEEEIKENRTINFYQWKDYMPEEILSGFEEETGIHVNLITFNDEFESKVEVLNNPGKYDLYVTGDPIVKEFISKDLLEKINKRKIKNFKNLDATFLYKKYDSENAYSIPYAYGTTGVIYNKKYVNKTPEVEDFWDVKYKGKIGMILDADIEVSFITKYVGSKIIPEQTKDYISLERFFDLQKENVFFGNYEIISQKLLDEELWISTIYGGLHLVLMENNEDLDYALPKGSLLWITNFVIPKGAENKEEAELFIDYILRPDNSKKIIEDGYAVPAVNNIERLTSDSRLVDYIRFVKGSDLEMISEYDENNLYDRIKETINEYFLEVENGS